MFKRIFDTIRDTAARLIRWVSSTARRVYDVISNTPVKRIIIETIAEMNFKLIGVCLIVVSVIELARGLPVILLPQLLIERLTSMFVFSIWINLLMHWLFTYGVYLFNERHAREPRVQYWRGRAI